MVNVINKIKEMQKKLNVINNNIDEIKNERKSLEESKKINDSLLTNSNTDKNKNNNFLYNLVNNKNKSLYPCKNNLQNSNFNSFKMNRTYNRNKTIINYENNSKYNNDFFPINNKLCQNICDKNSINNYSYKKKNNIKRNRAASSSNLIIDKYNLKKMKKKNRIKNYFYQKSLRNNKNKNNDYYKNDKYDNYKKNIHIVQIVI